MDAAWEEEFDRKCRARELNPHEEKEKLRKQGRLKLTDNGEWRRPNTVKGGSV